MTVVAHIGQTLFNQVRPAGKAVSLDTLKLCGDAHLELARAMNRLQRVGEHRRLERWRNEFKVVPFVPVQRNFVGLVAHGKFGSPHIVIAPLRNLVGHVIANPLRVRGSGH